MLNQNIKNYLDEHHIQYNTISHAPRYTASQTAQAAHISGKHLAKVVMVKINNKLAMVALPANAHIDLQALQKICKNDQVELAHEYEFSTAFPDCDIGAMPPFGDLYGMDVYLADSLRHKDWIVFNGGNHSDLIKMSSKAYLELAHPTLIPHC